MNTRIAPRRGFTLIELIIVIAIIAIIVAAVFVAMDPVKRLNASRNSTRRTDAVAIAQALSLYSTDTLAAGNTLDSEVDSLDGTTWQQLGTGDATACPAIAQCGSPDAGTQVAVAADCVDLAVLVPTYLRTIPKDPNGTDIATGYAARFENGAYQVKVCGPEGEGAGGTGNAPDIEVAR